MAVRVAHFQDNRGSSQNMTRGMDGGAPFVFAPVARYRLSVRVRILILGAQAAHVARVVGSAPVTIVCWDSLCDHSQFRHLRATKATLLGARRALVARALAFSDPAVARKGAGFARLVGKEQRVSSGYIRKGSSRVNGLFARQRVHVAPAEQAIKHKVQYYILCRPLQCGACPGRGRKRTRG